MYKHILRMLIIVLLLATPAWALQPIARTDVVPNQRIKYGTTFNFGVVAFSKPGINRVEFVISGQGYSGGTKTSSVMTLNTRVASAEYTGVWEYWVPISSSEFTSNGTITVTPTVYDNDANTRALDAVTLIVEAVSANANQVEAWVDPIGSDSTGTVEDINDPFPDIQSAVNASQAANGGTSSGNIIYLAEGTYSISGLSGSATGEWLTITKEATATRNNVIINQGRPRVSPLKLDNITLQSQGSSQYVLSNNNASYWTNSCRRIGSGYNVTNSTTIHMNLQGASTTGKYYSTDDYTYNVNFAYRSCQLIRGAVVEHVGHDVFQNYQFVVNCKVTTIDSYGSYNHADMLQVYQNNATMIPVQNRIAFNVYGTDLHYQGIMRTSVHQTPLDNAYINVFAEMRNPGGMDHAGGNIRLADILSTVNDDHLLVWHCSFPYAHSSLGNSATNSSYIGNVFWQARSTSGPQASTEWLHNHFMHVYDTTPACTPTSSGIDLGNPCPHWSATTHDTGVRDGGSDTHTIGDGVIDISTPGAADFGYPVQGSVLIDRLSSVYVPCDVLGNPRDSSPDIGALEAGSTEPAISAPTGLKIIQ